MEVTVTPGEDELADEMGEDSFPASDPPSTWAGPDEPARDEPRGGRPRGGGKSSARAGRSGHHSSD